MIFLPNQFGPRWPKRHVKTRRKVEGGEVAEVGAIYPTQLFANMLISKQIQNETTFESLTISDSSVYCIFLQYLVRDRLLYSCFYFPHLELVYKLARKGR